MSRAFKFGTQVAPTVFPSWNGNVTRDTSDLAPLDFAYYPTLKS